MVAGRDASARSVKGEGAAEDRGKLLARRGRSRDRTGGQVRGEGAGDAGQRSADLGQLPCDLRGAAGSGRFAERRGRLEPFGQQYPGRLPVGEYVVALVEELE